MVPGREAGSPAVRIERLGEGCRRGRGAPCKPYSLMTPSRLNRPMIRSVLAMNSGFF